GHAGGDTVAAASVGLLPAYPRPCARGRPQIETFDRIGRVPAVAVPERLRPLCREEMSFIPAAFAAIGKAVSSIGLGTLASTGSTVIAGIAAVQQARYQSAIAKANQEIANQNAAMALERSGLEAADQDALT